MGASIEEKSVWVQLVGMVVALGAYFVLAGRLLAAGVEAMPAYAALFIVATVGLVVALVAGHVVMAIVSRPEGRDERDRLIEWRAEHNSGWVQAAGVLTAVACMVVGVGNVWTANLLLLSMAASQVLSYVLRLVYYRRGV